MTGVPQREARYREHFAGASAAKRYDEATYHPDSYDAAIWRQQQPLLRALLMAERQRRPGLRLLDFACGTGRVLSFCERLVDTSVGVDVSSEMIERARARCPRSTLVVGDLSCDLVLPRQSYDVVTVFRYLLNVEPDERLETLVGLRERVADGGLLIANMHGSSRSIRHLSVGLRRWRRLRTHRPVDFVNEMSPSDLTSLLDEAGLQVVSLHGFGIVHQRAYRTVARPIAERLDAWAADRRVARHVSIDIVAVCRVA